MIGSSSLVKNIGTRFSSWERREYKIKWAVRCPLIRGPKDPERSKRDELLGHEHIVRELATQRFHVAAARAFARDRSISSSYRQPVNIRNSSLGYASCRIHPSLPWSRATLRPHVATTRRFLPKRSRSCAPSPFEARCTARQGVINGPPIIDFIPLSLFSTAPVLSRRDGTALVAKMYDPICLVGWAPCPIYFAVTRYLPACTGWPSAEAHPLNCKSCRQRRKCYVVDATPNSTGRQLWLK
jgi:hypothetical protein